MEGRVGTGIDCEVGMTCAGCRPLAKWDEMRLRKDLGRDEPLLEGR